MGVGNVAVIIDETAKLKDAAAKISASKIFDNATSCSSENHLIIVEEIYDAMCKALCDVGGVLLNDKDKKSLQETLCKTAP